MKIAIIGAGFAGLGAAYFLQEMGDVSLTLFDPNGVGGGASGVSSGLLHPYPGFYARRSHKADEALLLTKQLLRFAEQHTPHKVSLQNGILRFATNEEQKKNLKSYAEKWGDIEEVEKDTFLLHSGVTVLSQNYMTGLFRGLEKKGTELVKKSISTLEELDHFDHIIVAAGYGVRTFKECSHLNIKFLKGQSLTMEGEPPYTLSAISKGYIAHLGNRETFHLGSTYEREFQSVEPDQEVACALLSEKLALCKQAKILKCQAGVRVCNRSHYLPVVEKVGPKITVFTGLGSRGLLYHAYYGRILAHSLLSNNTAIL